MKQIESLAPNARQLAAESVAWMDRFWDEAAGLLWSPGDAPDPHTFDATPDLRGLADLEGLRWRLPGLIVQVESDAADVRGEAKADVIEVRYSTGAGKAIACTLRCLPGQAGH